MHIISEKIITENTPVVISVQGSEGECYAQNVTDVYVGFFGAKYVEIARLNGYELWTGFAGVNLHQNATTDELVMFDMGTTLGGLNRTIYWETSGEKQLSLALRYNNFDNFIHIYEHTNVHVYSFDNLRATQFTYVGGFGTLGAIIFGIFEVIPRIKKSK